MSGGKKTRGRQKIEIKKISNERSMQVAFSKRRNGLFQKAYELFTLCGAYVALIIFSPSGKVFSFGNPDLYTVIDRYFSRVPPVNNNIRQFIEGFPSTNVRDLNAQLTQANDALDREKKRGDDLSHICKMIEDPSWWASPIDEMNKDQLELLKKALEELNKNVAEPADRLEILGAPAQTQQAQMSPPHVFQNPMGGGGGENGPS
ncbi:agamous-like MADS-box protein AGL62 [Trifolium pratense]|uniref:Uncharacterized protein n=1 Tax=Trifolium pratense TaxID=57577 RepID=A0ACB0J1L3_TRIPR|nr:agamous-like MADS-box protein AGL62 [Trifolium pratense]CAJ2638000.1 unnamed protein product [Trifolium pratense]